jgi:hypothetical protein
LEGQLATRSFEFPLSFLNLSGGERSVVSRGGFACVVSTARRSAARSLSGEGASWFVGSCDALAFSSTPDTSLQLTSCRIFPP